MLATTYQKGFILGPLVPSRISFHSMTSMSGVGEGGGGGLEV